MTANNDFNDDNDDFTTPTTGAGAAGADDREGSANTDTSGASRLNADDSQAGETGPTGAATNDSVAGGEPVSDTDSGDDGRADTDADLPQLLREFSHVLRREFRAAAADSGFDPRDFGRMRRGRRRWDADDVVADGGAYPEEPVTYGPPRGRGGWGPNIDPDELRQRFRDMRDGVGDRIEEVLTSDEFENLKASLSKIVENFGPERCGDDPSRSDGEHDHPHGHDDHRGSDRHDAHGSHRGPGDHDRRRGGGRGRRGFGPSFGPGFGPGRRGFDPFGRADERAGREQEIQEAFERGFAAGFEQGRNS